MISTRFWALCLLALNWCGSAQSQLNDFADFPCEGKTDRYLKIPAQKMGVSSISGDNLAAYAIDGHLAELEFAQTEIENDPYMEFDLGSSYFVEEFELFSTQDDFSNVHAIVSETPLVFADLEATLNQPFVHWAAIRRGNDGEARVAVGGPVRYLRIQRAGFGDLRINEVTIIGDPGPYDDEEICDNGIDDDCDGLVDCADPDCAPVIWAVNGYDPSCPECCIDGRITIQAFGDDLQVSIDGGVTWVDYVRGQILEFSGLAVGSYDIVVRNRNCTVNYGVIVLSQPQGDPTESCANGGFEDGNLNGWTGSSGHWEDTDGDGNGDTPVIDHQGFGNDTPCVLTTDNLQDDCLDMATNQSAGNGDYLVQLGNADAPFGEINALEYCFVVDASNQDFNFTYAVVLENPENHPPEERPYFKYTLSSSGDVIAEELHNASDEFFQNVCGGAVKGWTVECFDLSAYLGEEVCINFEVGDCGWGGHFGYAYIDGICADKEDVTPTAAVSIDNAYCQNQVVTATGDGSDGYNRYSWTVCRYYNGQPAQCYSTEPQIGFNTPVLDDVLGFFFGDHPNAGELNCGDTFRVTLNLYNDCYYSSASRDFQYICEENLISYQDIVVCSNLRDLPITGTNDCDGCEVHWSNGQYLNNAHIPFPTIEGSRNIYAFDVPYVVEVVNEWGCVYRDTVQVYTAGEILGEVELLTQTLDHCEFEVTAEVKLDSPMSPSSLQVTFTVDGDRYDGVLLSGPGSSTLHTFGLPMNLARGEDHSIHVRVLASHVPGDAVVYGNCTLAADIHTSKDSPFFGDVDVYVPNVFTPNGDGINDLFFPSFGPDPGVYEAFMTIYDRWGELLFEGHAVAPIDGPGLTGQEPGLPWDGTFNGQSVAAGVYVWVLDYQNCTTPPAGCFDCSVWDIDGGDCGNCNEANGHYGDVTVIY